MPMTRGERLLARFWSQLLERAGSYWAGPGARALGEYMTSGRATTGLDELLTGWLRWSAEPVMPDLDAAIEASTQEVPVPAGRRPSRPSGGPAVVLGGYTFEAKWRWAPVEKIAAEVTAITAEQRDQIAGVLQRGMIGELTVDETARELRSVVGLHPRQVAAIARAEERLAARGLTGDALAKRVEALRKRALRYRAWNIARSSYARLLQHEQLEAAEPGAADSAGVDIWLAWMITPDERLCPICSAMSGKEVPYGSEFQLPNGRSVRTPAYSHPQCRCALVVKRRHRSVVMRARLADQALAQRYQDYLAQLPGGEAAAVGAAVDDAVAAVTRAVGLSEGELLEVFRSAAMADVVGSVHWGYREEAARKLADALGLGSSWAAGALRHKWSSVVWEVGRALREWVLSRAPAEPARVADGGLISDRVKRLVASSGIRWEEVRVRKVRARRSSANVVERVVSLGSDADEGVQLHELLHLVEVGGKGDLPRLSARIRDGIITGNRVRPLREVSSAYESHEVGYPALYHEYIGKTYAGETTEVLAMCGSFLMDEAMAGVLLLERQLLAHLVYALGLY